MEIDKLYKITFRDRVFYVSSDGRFLLQGTVIDVSTGRDVTDKTWDALDSEVEQRIRRSLPARMPGLMPETVRSTPITSVHEITVNDRVFYVSRDGRFFLSGKLVDLETGSPLTDKRVGELRLSMLNEISDEQTLIYSPKNPKHTVTVFTDTDCGFCRRMHAELDQYKKQGIAFRYLFFVPDGVGSPTYEKAVSVWCADDRHAAMDKAKSGASMPTRTCDNPIEAHSDLGRRISVQGTPTMVLADGMILPGYTAPTDLRSTLDERFP
jgi:thiol:disulfide interchange protein DsbC